MDENKIKNDAKKIMDNFMLALSKIKIKEKFILERETSFREEFVGKVLDEDFKERFLLNANKLSSDAIVANKGAWIE